MDSNTTNGLFILAVVKILQTVQLHQSENGLPSLLSYEAYVVSFVFLRGSFLPAFQRDLYGNYGVGTFKISFWSCFFADYLCGVFDISFVYFVFWLFCMQFIYL